MQWAQEISVEQGRLVARVFDGAASRSVALNELDRSGLPTERSFTKRGIQTNFSDWREVPAGEYAAAFDLKGANEGFHSVYETYVGKRRLLTPALALIRTFFGLNANVLANVFRPCALDRITVLDGSVEPPAAVLSGLRIPRTRVGRLSDNAQRLSWMRSHLSAQDMLASVHESAMLGRIGLNLPPSTVCLVAHGRRVKETLFVTGINVLSVSPHDEPILFCQMTAETYHFRAVRTKAHRGRVDTNDYSDIPRRNDGSIELSDAEWQEIEPLMLTTRGRSRIRLDQRLILDGVLTKLATRVSWASVKYKAGGVTHATSAFRRFAGDGRFETILSILAKHRT